MNRLVKIGNGFYAKGFRRATADESEGRWDYIVTVSRLSPGYAVAQEKVSGGRALAESIADALLERVQP